MFLNQANLQIPRGCAGSRLQKEHHLVEAIMRNLIATERAVLGGFNDQDERIRPVILTLRQMLDGFEAALDAQMEEFTPVTGALEQRTS